MSESFFKEMQGFGNFSEAVKCLRELKMIEEEREGQFITLAAEISTDQIVRRLVEQGMPLFEIACVEQTLEDFYLSLMKGSR